MGDLPLTGLRVLELGTGIAVPFATRLLADVGAEVLKVEPLAGDPLRSRRADGGAVDPATGGALFAYVNAGKASLPVDLASGASDHLDDLDAVLALAATADVVIADADGPIGHHFDHARLLEAAPHAVVASVSSFGLDGPWRDRPAADLSIQAQCGSMARRGHPSRPPLSIGGTPVDWVAALYTTLSVLLSRWRCDLTGTGEHLDVSKLEAFTHGTMVWKDAWERDAVRPERTLRSEYFPSVLPCADGMVAIQTLTGQHWEDFCVLVEHPEWLADESLYAFSARHDPALYEAAAAWTSTRTVAEVVEVAQAMRIPAAPINTGATLPELEQFVARGTYQQAPEGFVRPVTPFDVCGAQALPIAPAPALGAGGDERATDWLATPSRWADVSGDARLGREDVDPRLPFAGLRVADFTGYYAASAVGQVFASCGAEVIHIESPKRIDTFRMMNCRIPIPEPQWWESSIPWFQPNAGKRSLTLDLDQPEGQALAHRLVATSDVVTDGFTSRVLERWHLGYEDVHRLRPEAVMVRMSSFGTTGPWRERSGFAPTVEAASGLTWTTGHPEGTPVPPTTLADPVATVTSATAALLALYSRRRTGTGQLVDSPMTGAAVSIGAETVVEHSAYGHLVERMGNRSLHAAPQGAYATSVADDDWIVLAVETDEQFAALAAVVGRPDWVEDPRYADLAGRRQHHDELDAVLGPWVAGRPIDAVVDQLLAAGVPAAHVVPDNDFELPAVAHRGFRETVKHPVLGDYHQIGWPVRFSGQPGPWLRGPAPLLGEHNAEVLGTIGVEPGELDRLEADGIIGSAPRY